jgi:hypothetical protein
MIIGLPNLMPQGAMQMFGETHYQRAYQRGWAWAEDVFRGWLESGQPVPRELPFSKHDAPAILEQSAMNLESHARAVSVFYATARVRWRRLVSQEYNRRAS